MNQHFHNFITGFGKSLKDYSDSNSSASNVHRSPFVGFKPGLFVELLAECFVARFGFSHGQKNLLKPRITSDRCGAYAQT